MKLTTCYKRVEKITRVTFMEKRYSPVFASVADAGVAFGGGSCKFKTTAYYK
jgi:hypothetical protein